MNPEARQFIPISRDVQVVQKWLEEEVAGRGICPPLLKLLQRYTSEAGIDWQAVSSEVDIETFKSQNPRNKQLVTTVAASYVRYIINCARENGPYTKVIILPDFKSNAEYDEFMLQVKFGAITILQSSQENILLMKSIYERVATARSADPQSIKRLIDNPALLLVLATQVVEGAFNPVYFYGKQIGVEDIQGFNGNRGPIERQKILARAPYYLLQVVNSLKSSELIGIMDRKKLHQHNTALALHDNVASHEEKMWGFRKIFSGTARPENP